MKVRIDEHEYDITAAGEAVTVDGTSYEVKVEGAGTATTVLVNGKRFKVHQWKGAVPEGVAAITHPGDTDLAAPASNEHLHVNVDGKIYAVAVEGAMRATAKAAPKKRAQAPMAAGAVMALMPGRVVRVDVEEGQAVEEGQILLVLEAMKMENEIRADAAGTVKSIAVARGASVAAGDTLIVIE